ncbi:MAG: macro domain-containing protein [Ruminococcus sp.]|nr:macro domain-containing protein [Ruminococcus sp.]
MIYNEKNADLFSVDDDFFLVHCVSADFVLGKGIALEFQKRFNMKNKLRANGKTDSVCVRIDKVFNLITKKTWRNKPTYESLEKSLAELKRQTAEMNVRKIAIPKIACGLDGLEWEKVSKMIRNIFSDTDIDILVCCL